MPPGLLVAITRTAPFNAVLADAQRILSILTQCSSIPSLRLEYPSELRVSPSPEDAFISVSFSAYVTLHNIEGSMVDFGIFPSGGRGLLMVYCSSVGRTAYSDVLVAVMSIAAARVLDGKIIDGQNKWISAEECSAKELIDALALPEEQKGLEFVESVLAVSKKQARPASYGYTPG